ncbi:MAG: MMPL family transporter [bacterium]|nr:MMPL family transporter [bacterium]
MKKFADLVLKYRVIIIISTIAITLFMSYQITTLKINSDVLKYLPQDDPHVVLFNEVGDKFGGNSLAMVALETKDVFNSKTLERINEITQQFKLMPEISYVTSITDVIDIKKIEDGLEVGKLIDEYDIPTDPDELQRIREYTLAKEMYRSNVVSEDGTVTVIIARLKEGIDKITVAQQLKQIVLRTSGDEKIYFGGIPFQMISLTEIIQKDIIFLIPLVVLLLAITLALTFQTFRGVLLPLITVFISTAWALGIMALFNINLTIASNGMPVLLLAIGSAYGIHMVTKYKEDILLGENKFQAIKDALSEVGVPIFLAGLTTMIGFLAFLTSNLTLIKQFGIFTGMGVFIALIVSITFLPALLSFMSPPKIKRNEKGQQDTTITRILDKLGAFVFKRKKLVLVIGLIIFVAGVLALPNIHREVNMVDYFKESSEIRQAEDMMEAKLGGSIPIQILVKGDLKEPAVLNSMMKLEKYLQTLPDVNSPQSIADLICEMNDVMNDRYSIPPSREGVANLWFFIDGNEVLPQLINDDAKEGLIQAKLGTVNTGKIIAVVDMINEYMTKNMDTTIVQFEFVNMPIKELESLKAMRAQEIINRIRCDVRNYVPNFEINAQSEKVIEKYIAQDKNSYDETFYQQLENELSNYFGSDVADLIIDNPDHHKKIIADLVKNVHANADLTEDSLNDLLKKIVPSIYYQDDPELLEYTAQSITAIISNEKQWYRVNNLMAELSQMLPKDLQSNKSFTRKIIGDLWVINENTFSAPSKIVNKFKLGGLKSDPELIKMKTDQTGMPIIFKDLDQNIVTSQVFSLIIAIGLVLILLSFQFRSAVGGLISVMPIMLTILFNFTIMVILNIPLDAVTVMIGSVAVGIGIDYTIHFNSRFRLEMSRSMNQLKALQKTLETTGRAILINALSVMMGFLALVLGSIVPMQRFGWMIALTMLTSALFALTFLPAVIMLSHAKFVLAFKQATKNMLLKNKKNKFQ